MLPTPATLTTVISPPRKRSRTGTRHSIIDAERRDLRWYWQQKPAGQKPTQNVMRLWFSAKYRPIFQSTVSDSLKPMYDYLNKEKKLAHPKRSYKTQGNWPDLEAALH
jgi:Fission yeast centromere protein N-terminal domain